MEKTKTSMKTRLARTMACGAMVLTLGTATIATVDVLAPTDNVALAATIGSKYNSKDSGDTSQGKLREAVDNAVADKIYKGTDDRDYRGSELVKNGMTNDKVELLRRDQREKLFTDMNNEVERQIQKSKDAVRESPNEEHRNVIDSGTKSNWLKDLQNSPGMGTEIISAVLSDFKPNLTAGHQILAPFEGWFGTAAGIFVIIAMLGLILTITIDMAYLFFPAFQQLVTAHANNGSKGGNGGGGFFASKYNNLFVSREAIQALEEAEKSDNGGRTKSPYGIYFWKKGAAMFVFGILLMYLAQGDMWRFVGLFLDALKGFGL